MMQFTPQQIGGGPKYGHKTRVGNWLEDFELEEIKLKDYLKKKDSASLTISNTEKKFAKSLAKVPFTNSPDGFLKFGDKIMLMNKMTNGAMALDVGDKIPTYDEAYAVTTNNKNIGATARSVFVIERVNEDDEYEDDKVYFGQEIRFRASPWIFHKPVYMNEYSQLYLRSCPTSPQAYARFSRHQEVCMFTKKNYDTVWTLESSDPNYRLTANNSPLLSNTPLIIKHKATSHYLASDIVEYRNDFGTEYEVCVHSFATLNKSQQLALENSGKLTREIPTKFQHDQNVWMVVTGTPQDAMVPEPNKLTVQDLVREVKEKLLERGAYGIRGLARVFKNMDDNGNRKLDPNDFKWGLYDYGFDLSMDDVKLIIQACDRDGDGNVDYDEFLRFVRGDLNEARKGMIAQAYRKLDKNGDGSVTLEDVAGLYDASMHPDVIDGKKTPEEIYKEFMTQWDTQKADGIVTLDEFMDYYKDVSASVDRDDYFELMMRNAWKL